MNKVFSCINPFVMWVPFIIVICFTVQTIYYYYEPHPIEFDSVPPPSLYINPPTFETSLYQEFENLEERCHAPKVQMNNSFFTIGQKNPSQRFLCDLSVDNYCKSFQVSEMADTFWIVCPAYASYQSFIQFRYILHENYKNYIQSFGLPFSTIEAIRTDRHQEFLLTKPGNEPYDIQLEFYNDMYIRENLLNVAARKIKGWEYMAWIDTHQLFENVYWWEESIVKMEKNASVQLFQNFVGISPNNKTDFRAPGGMHVSLFQSTFDVGPAFFFGNAYGIRKDLYDKIVYIYDECIASCCDCAWVLASVPEDYPYSYFFKFGKYTGQMMDWVNHTREIFQGSRHIVRGDIFHLYHEHTFDYNSIMVLVNASDFNIKRDLKRDSNYTLRLYNDEVEEIFDKKTFWTAFGFYFIDLGIRYYLIYSLAFVISSLVAWYVNRRVNFDYTLLETDRKKRKENNKSGAKYISR